MQLRKIQSDDKIQFRVRLHHLANKYVLTSEKLGHALGVIQTRSQNQRNPNAPTSEERSVEWTLNIEEKLRKTAWTFYTKKVNKVPGAYSEDRNKFCKLSPREQCFFTYKTMSKERVFIHCGLGSFASYDG